MLEWTLIFYPIQGLAQDGCSHVHCSWNQPILELGNPKNSLLVAMVCQQQDLRLHDDFFHGQCPRRSTGLNWRVWNVLQWLVKGTELMKVQLNCISRTFVQNSTYFNFSDVPVWSKLETGRIPQPPELFQILDNQLQFQPQASSAFHPPTPSYSS